MSSEKIKTPCHPMTLFNLTGQNTLVIGIGGLGAESALGLAGDGSAPVESLALIK